MEALLLPQWRPMQYADLPTVHVIGNIVHLQHYERPQIFDERLRLFPSGCFTLYDQDLYDDLVGYAVAYPICLFDPPPLDSLLGSLPLAADCLYIHDVALLPAWRKKGQGSTVVKLLKELARSKGTPWMSLVSIHDSRPFWEKQGFQTFHFVIGSTTSSEKIASQGSGAIYMTTCRF